MKSFWNKNRRLLSLAGFLICVNAGLLVVLAGKTQDEKMTGPDAWAKSSLSTAREVPFSLILEQIRSANTGDLLAIFPDRILFQDTSFLSDEDVIPDNLSESKAHTVSRLNSVVREMLADIMLQTKAEVVFSEQDPALHPVLAGFLRMLEFIIPVGILIAALLYFQMRGVKGKGAHESIEPAKIQTGLDDVAGIDSVRAEVREVIDILRNPDAAARMGARAPKGLLLSGPPGTGKTLLAKAMAKEAGVNFMSVDASSLNQLYMGMGSLRVRQAFAAARKAAPCIIFMDEIDAIGNRGSGEGIGRTDQEKSSTINALLTELDGISSSEKIFLIAATNLPERLDPALVRPGRIDRRVHLNVPDRKGRREILDVHIKGIPCSGIDLDQIAGFTPGLSGADLANLCNEAALRAAREGRTEVTIDDFMSARDRAMIGQTGSQITLDEDERRITAYHEAGHALVASLLPAADPIEKVTILPRGGALGYVLQIPDRDRRMERLDRLEARMMVLAAGRAAELIIFGRNGMTTGASSDIEALTRIATGMVTQWGMGKAGFVSLARQNGSPHSEAVQQEVMAIAEASMTQASAMLEEHGAALREIAERLLESDTMTGQEVKDMICALESGRIAA